MPAIPSVVVTVQDNGASAALSVPQSNVQLVVGCAVGGTVNQPFATTSPTVLQNQFVGGPLVEGAGMVCQAGGVAVCVSCPIVTKGTAYTVQATTPNGSSSPVTVQLDGTNGAWDTYYVVLKPTAGGTVGTAGIFVQVSLDAGRNFGAPMALPLSGVLVLGAPYSPATVGGTGVQVTFGAGTVKMGDSWQFGTVGPQWNGAGVAAAIAAFQNSQYGVAGVGSMHVVGDAMHGGSGAADIATIQTQMQAGVAIYEYNRAIVELRDALAPTAWGGSGETEAAWIVALSTATSGLTVEARIARRRRLVQHAVSVRQRGRRTAFVSSSARMGPCRAQDPDRSPATGGEGQGRAAGEHRRQPGHGPGGRLRLPRRARDAGPQRRADRLRHDVAEEGGRLLHVPGAPLERARVPVRRARDRQRAGRGV